MTEIPQVSSEADEEDLLRRLHSENRERRLGRHLAFVGFMGAGKSSLGRLIAGRLGRRFIDTDELIERHTGRSIPDFFRAGEESAFRAHEAQTIRELLAEPPMVLSLGGGALQNPQTRALLFERCFVVHLFVSWAQVRSSLPSLVEGRPVLEGLSQSEVHALWLRRQRSYRDAHLRIDAPRGDLSAAADEIFSRLFGAATPPA